MPSPLSPPPLAAPSTGDRPRPAGGARRRLPAVIAGGLLVTVVASGLAGCGRSSSGFGRLTVDGQAQISPAHGASHSARSGDILHAGDTFQVTTGDAAVRVLAGGVFQLRAGARLTVGHIPRLGAGQVLIQPAGHPLQVAALDATFVVPAGVAQLQVGSITTGLTAKVYQASSHLDIAGNPPAPINAPRQINLTPQTRLPVQASPLQYQDSDPWDHMYLAEAETISMQLAAAATGFNAQLPANEGHSAAFYVQLLPVLGKQPDFASVFDLVQSEQPATSKATMPADYLIASIIALRGTRGSFQSRLSGELAFESQGAPWGFVAYDQGVTDLAGVLNDVLAAIGRATPPLVGAPASQIAIGPPPAVASPPTTRASVSPPTPTTTVATTQHPVVSTTTTTPPPLLHLPVPLLPGPLGSLLNPLLDPLIQALNNILGGGKG